MFLGIDLGTGSIKALLVSSDGNQIAQANESCPPLSPRAGFSEADPNAWWDAIGRAVRTAVAGRSDDVRAIGLSGQMHGAVGLDAAHEPVHAAILWPDLRASAQLARYRSLGPAELDRLANPIAVGMAGASMLWLLDNHPEVLRRAQFWVQPKDWLRARLVGRVASEHSDASATLLYDVAAQTWAVDTVHRLSLDPAQLAPLMESDEVAGGLTDGAARHLGLRAGVPVAAGGADAACALFGNGELPTGWAQLTVGSGATVTVQRDVPVSDRTSRTHLYRTVERDRWYAMAAMQNVGIALDWVRRTLGMSWGELYGTLSRSSRGARGLTFLPYLSAERTPHVDPFATGSWTGLQVHHDRDDLARAAVEGCAMAIRDGLDALLDTGARIDVLRLAGGGSVDVGWRQMIADLLDRPIASADMVEASAFGACRLAARGVGVGLPTPPIDAAFVAEPQAVRGAWDEALARFRGAYVAQSAQRDAAAD